MRFASLIALGCLLISSCVLAAPLTPDSLVDDVLDALNARGKDLHTLTADVKTSFVDPDSGDVGPIKTGKLFFRDRGNGDVQFRIVFDKRISGKAIENRKHDYVYLNGAIIDRDYHLKQQNTHQVLKPGEKMEIFKLDGPFPLPLGQDKADVHKTFNVQKIALKKDEPAGTLHLSLTPNPGTDLARKFSSLNMWIDPKTSMPIRIDSLSSNGTSLDQTELSNVQVNGPVKDSDFQLEQIDLKKEGWNSQDGELDK